MELGIKINQLKELKETEYIFKYKYIYFGNEFCERKIPDLDFSKKILEFCIKEGKTPVFLTPILTDKGIKDINYLLIQLYNIKKDFEITINDLGMLPILKSFPELKINCGRLLIKMKKGPEITSGALKESPENFKDSSLSNSLFIKFLRNNNIFRAETDIPLQGINLDNARLNNFNISLYLGNNVISATRRCAYPKANTQHYDYKISYCNKECLNYLITKANKYYKTPIFVVGNAEFIKTPFTIPKSLKNEFNRMVIFPDLESNL